MLKLNSFLKENIVDFHKLAKKCLLNILGGKRFLKLFSVLNLGIFNGKESAKNVEI